MINKSKKKILITGGAGFIGSLLATRLVFLGHYVTVVDKFLFKKNSLDHLMIYENFNLVKGDIRNKKMVKNIVKDKDIVIPLAALVGAPLCEKNKKLAIETNLNSISYLVSCLKKRQKIIYPTTNSGYGVGKKNKYCDENSELNPISLYGRTKVEAEKIILKHKNSVCFRLATVFGTSFRMRTDLLVNNLTLIAMKERKLTMFEPKFRRNYVHIADVISAFIFTIDNFSKMKGEVFNFGLSSANLTKLSLAQKIKKLVKKVKIIIIHNKKDPDQRDYFVSNKKIEKLGFKAQIPLEKGILELINYYKNNSSKIINNY